MPAVLKERNMETKETPRPGAEGESASLAEIALEREKVQIERERLALERERWTAERDKRDTDRALQNRATGRVTMGLSTLTLALLTALLTGGTLGAWVVSSRARGDNNRMAASLIQALGSETNATGASESRLLRALGRPGRGGGYLLILD
jgi:hypothetical protein